MMKKNILFSTLLLPICISLVGCKGSKKSDTHIWWSYAAENLISDFNYFDKEIEENKAYMDRDKTLRFNCMKNENEGVQLMISPIKDIESFDFILPDVTSSSGTITKDHFSVSVAYYMNVDFSNERMSLSGLYPDALIPLENYKTRRLNYIENGYNQALYINLTTADDVSAGLYKGTGKLILDDETIDIPFEVNVFDATMSNTNHIKSCFLIWYELIANGEKRNAGPEMNQKYFDFLVSKRLSPGELPPELKVDNQLFVDNYIEKVAKNDKVSGCRLISNGNYTKENARDILQKLITKSIQLRNQGDTTTNAFKKAYFYIDDEPTAERYATVRQHDKEIFELKKELAPQLASYPDLYESFTHMENVVTTPYNESLVANAENDYAGVECWCPQAQNFQSQQARDLYKSRQSSADRDFGEHVWWYVCNDPVMPYPNYHLDANVITAREFRYMHYNYGIDGTLFWNVCYYAKEKSDFVSPRDLWNDPISWESCAGDGMLVYPGLTFGIDGPITTLRLENILAGNEEYEYLWMIEQKVQEYNALHGTNYVANTLLQKYYAKLYTNMISNLDVDALEEVRIELLSIIEALYKNLDDGIAMLTK